LGRTADRGPWSGSLVGRPTRSKKKKGGPSRLFARPREGGGGGRKEDFRVRGPERPREKEKKRGEGKENVERPLQLES